VAIVDRRVRFVPTDADARWAAENLNGDSHHTDEPTPFDVVDNEALELAAQEAEAQDRLDRGYCC
jgi:hypothetical protein